MINPSNFKLYQGETLAVGARIVASHRLYIEGWSIKSYIDFINRFFGKSSFKTERYRIAIVYKVGSVTPIGCALAIRNGAYRKWGVAFFIKEKYRRKGYATQLFKTLDLPTSWKIEVGEGEEGSAEFFEHLKTKIANRLVVTKAIPE